MAVHSRRQVADSTSTGVARVKNTSPTTSDFGLVVRPVGGPVSGSTSVRVSNSTAQRVPVQLPSSFKPTASTAVRVTNSTLQAVPVRGPSTAGALMRGGPVVIGGMDSNGNAQILEVVADNADNQNVSGASQRHMASLARMQTFNGTGWDRVRGTIANGVDVDVTRIQGLVAITSTSVLIKNTTTARIPTRATQDGSPWSFTSTSVKIVNPTTSVKIVNPTTAVRVTNSTAQRIPNDDVVETNFQSFHQTIGASSDNTISFSQQVRLVRVKWWSTGAALLVKNSAISSNTTSGASRIGIAPAANVPNVDYFPYKTSSIHVRSSVTGSVTVEGFF